MTGHVMRLLARWNIVLIVLLLASAACDPESPPRGKESPAHAAPGSKADPGVDQAGDQAGEKTAGQPGPAFVYAPAEGDVADLVAQARSRANARGQELIVYVSATWCEPCRYFEAAVKSGALAEAFPRLQLFKFDLDRDRDRLAQAGYVSDLIPLFAIPGEEGRATGQMIQGSVKGADAVATNIVPRLRQLLGR